MFDLPSEPQKMPDNFRLIIQHIDAMWRLLNKLERQVLEYDLGLWEETFSDIREAGVWIGDGIEEALAAEAWTERKAEETFYGKEVYQEVLRKREERKRGAAT